MSTSTTEITKVNLAPRDMRIPCSSMRTGSRPFVVCSTNTKRYAPPLSTKPPAVQMQRFPLRTAANTRRSVSLEASTNRKARPGLLLTVVPKAKQSHPSTSLYPAPIPAPSRTTKALQLPTRGDARHEKTGVFRPTQTSRDDKVGRFRASMQSTQDDLPPRPSCVPRSRISRTSSGIPATGKGKPDVAVKVAASARNRGADCKVYANTRVVKTVRCPQVSGPSVDWSPPPQNLSSFSSQTWTIVVSADTRRNKTSTTVCSDETTPSTVGGEPNSSEKGTDEAPVAISSDGIPHSAQAGSKSMSKVERTVETQTTVRGDAIFGIGDGYLHPEHFAFPADWSPPPSPNLSSFPSQTWTIVVSADDKRNEASTTVCSSAAGDEPQSNKEGTDETPGTISGDGIPHGAQAGNKSTSGVGGMVETQTGVGGDAVSDIGDGFKVPLKTIGCAHTEPFAFPADWSPPPSPNVSSFPSQTWTVLVDTGAQRNKTFTTIYDGETVETKTRVGDNAITTGDGFKVPWKTIGYPHTKPFAFPAAWSPSSSPNMSLFQSHTWTVHVDTSVKRNETATMVYDGETPSNSGKEPKSGEGTDDIPATICGDGIPYSTGDESATVETSTRIGNHETPSDVDDGFRSSIAGMPNDSCAPSESSFFPSIVDSPMWYTTCAARSEAMGGLSSATIDPSVRVSSMVCPATIIVPSKNGTTSAARLARLMDQHQTPSGGNRTQTVVRRAIRAAQTLFLPRRGLQSKEAVVLPAMGTDLLRIHRRFVPKPDKGVRQDKDPTVQKKIVAGWW